METSGYAPREYFEEMLDSIDLFLFDYKVSNPKKHRNYCGVDNGLVLENLEYLYSTDKKIVLRLPLIPGFNDDEEHFDSIADILRSHPDIERAEIMAYHNLGAGKAGELGLPVNKALPPKDADSEVICGWIESFRARGCTNVFQKRHQQPRRGSGSHCQSALPAGGPPAACQRQERSYPYQFQRLQGGS
jgi:pyruvate formate lyase activating enzyme